MAEEKVTGSRVRVLLGGKVIGWATGVGIIHRVEDNFTVVDIDCESIVLEDKFLRFGNTIKFSVGTEPKEADRV